jgi:hypothetical protein
MSQKCQFYELKGLVKMIAICSPIVKRDIKKNIKKRVITLIVAGKQLPKNHGVALKNR